MNHPSIHCPACGTPNVRDSSVCARCGAKLPTLAPLIIGADPECHIRLDLPTISGRHCSLTRSDGGWMLQDLGSRNGTYVDGSRIAGPRLVQPHQFITLGTETLFPWTEVPGLEGSRADDSGRSITIGRNPKSAMVIDQPMVSWDHARMSLRGQEWWIEDLASANGLAIHQPTNLIKAAPVKESDQVFFGSHAVDGSLLLARANALTRPLPPIDTQVADQPGPPVSPEPSLDPMKNIRARNTLVAIGLGLAVLLGIGIWSEGSKPHHPQPAVPYPAVSSAEGLTPAMVFEKVKDSVVIVKVFDANGEMQGFGSGVKLPSGRIVTNFHVVKDGWRFEAGRAGTFVAATVYASNADRDVCLLEAPGLDVPAASVGSASRLNVGDKVYAVGSPQGLELSLSDGLVSQLRGGNPPYIQTTAAISPGSSGGGLFDSQGSLVGITSFYFKGGQNLNFALPVDWTRDLEPSTSP